MTTKTRAQSKTRTLPELSPEQARTPTEEHRSELAKDAYEDVLENLEHAPSAAKEQVRSATGSSDCQSGRGEPVAAPKHPAVTKPEYCLILVRDGGWPVLEICGDVESLTKRMRALEGEYVNVIPFFGIPVPYTKGPGRFLQLPDGQPYPVFDCLEIGTFVPRPMATLPIDMSYFLGPDMGSDQCDDPTVIDHRPMSAR